MSKTFDDIAAAQGWNAESREQILKDFIATGGTDLDDYARKRAIEENGTSTLPDLSMDVTGEYQGNAYPETHEYRITMTREDDQFLMDIEDTTGMSLGTTAFSAEEVDGITEMAMRDHSLSGYEDDWTIPEGMNREIVWTLPTDGDHWIQLKEGEIDEVAAWLRYATGEDEWTGGSEWEF
jgi:hypothetical protein